MGGLSLNLRESNTFPTFPRLSYFVGDDYCMANKRRTEPRESVAEVYNTSPFPVMVDSKGTMCAGSTTTIVDPDDPRAAELIASGDLIIKEIS